MLKVFKIIVNLSGIEKRSAFIKTSSWKLGVIFLVNRPVYML